MASKTPQRRAHFMGADAPGKKTHLSLNREYYRKLYRMMERDDWSQRFKELPYKQDLLRMGKEIASGKDEGGRLTGMGLARKSVGRVLRGAPVMGQKASNRALKADIAQQMQIYDKEFAPRLGAEFLGIGQGPGSSRASLMRENYLNKIGIGLSERQFARQQQQSQLALAAAPAMGQLQLGQLGALRGERVAGLQEMKLRDPLSSPTMQAVQVSTKTPDYAGSHPGGYADDSSIWGDLGAGLGFLSTAFTGGGGGAIPSIIAGVGSFFSDIRLKENISLIGQSKSGIPVYKFSYKEDDKVWIGVMAQDLLIMGKEDAVHRDKESGYYKVDYSKIDVKMKLLK